MAYTIHTSEDNNMSAKQTNYIGGPGVEDYDDGVVLRGAARWQKHGHDRVYPGSAREGYIDLNDGGIEELKAHYDSGVDEYRMDYNAEKNALELVEVPRPDVASKCGAEERVVATIPRELF